MTPLRLATLTTLAMLAFAGKSVLCRVALKLTPLDAASFTAVRLLSGAAMLWLLVWLRQRARAVTATGALLLFGTVQVTMIGWGLAHGEHLRRSQWLGFCVALTVLATATTRRLTRS